MTSLSPAAGRICHAAIRHFADVGYDGGSLSTIAGDVGIRKASLYSHFTSKDALFLASFGMALKLERAFVSETFSLPQPNGAGSAFIAAIAERFAASPSLRFILRAAYHLPKTIGQEVGAGYESYLDLLRHHYQDQLKTNQPRLQPDQTQRFAEAYVGITESLFVELLYGTVNRTVARRDALWSILSQAVQRA